MAKINQGNSRKGSPNKGNGYLRSKGLNILITEGAAETIDALKALDPSGKTSRSDVIHEALQLYAIRKLSDKRDLYYVNRIL